MEIKSSLLRCPMKYQLFVQMLESFDALNGMPCTNELRLELMGVSVCFTSASKEVSGKKLKQTVLILRDE